MKRIISVFVISVVFSSYLLFGQDTDTRGLKNIIKSLDEYAGVGKQYILLIAINKYKEWNPLKNPVADAKQLKNIFLENYYVDEIIELYDDEATKSGILKTFKGLQDKINSDDSLLIYYAGHGYLDNEITKNAYWIPSDGGLDNFSQDNWIPNSSIRGMIGAIKSKHILLVSDSCFSGDLLNAHRGKTPSINEEYFANAYKRRARQILTSGSSEEVPDESSFSRQFILALRDNNRPLIDPLMIFNEIRLGVRGTTPMLGSLEGTDHQEGASFLLFRKEKEVEKIVEEKNNKIEKDKVVTEDNKIEKKDDISYLTEKYLKDIEAVSISESNLNIIEQNIKNLKLINEFAVSNNLNVVIKESEFKINKIKENAANIINKEIDKNLSKANKQNIFDPSINDIKKYSSHSKNIGLSEVTDLIDKSVKDIEMQKNLFESKKISEIKFLKIDEDNLGDDVQIAENILEKVKDEVEKSESSFNNLESEIKKSEEFVSLNKNLLDINNKLKNSTRNSTPLIASASVMLSLGLGCAISGGALLGVYGYYGAQYNTLYNDYKTNPTGDYNKIIEYANYSNNSMISGAVLLPISLLFLIPSIALYGVNGMTVKYKKDYDNIKGRIKNLNIGYNNKEELTFEICFGL